MVAPPPPTTTNGPPDPGLRGPIDPAAPLSPPPTLALVAAGSTDAPPPRPAVAPAAIQPLPVVGDPAPICRAECAKTRIVCAAGSEEGNCDVRWVECLSACAEPRSSQGPSSQTQSYPGQSFQSQSFQSQSFQSQSSQITPIG